jgi:hypothetical protein
MSDVCEGCGQVHTQEEFDSLTGGPSEQVMQAAVDTFRALTTLRVGQVSQSESDVDMPSLHAATEPIQSIATVIMFLRHSIKRATAEGDHADADEMASMLFAVEVVTAVATMGPMLLADHIMHGYEREFTPQHKFAERWANEIDHNVPPFDANEND